MDHSTQETKKNTKTCVSVPDLVVCVGVFFRLSKTVSAVFLLFENGCVDAHLFDLPDTGAIVFWQLFGFKETE